MKAFRIHEAGETPVLDTIPVPEPGPGDVRVRVAGSGLNFADLLMIKGQYQDMPPLPATLGLEFAGTVEALGDEVGPLSIGDRVAAYAGHGGLAEYAVVDAERCVRVPDDMPDEIAAGFLIAYGTSHLALTRTARLQPDETLLVLGAAGGVGLTAVEIGKSLGARVVAVARGPMKLEIAGAAGADHLIDSEAEDIREIVRGLGGADVVYDAVGGDAFAAAMRATNPEGRLLAVGFASGDIPQIPANHLLVKNLSVHGFYWGGFLKFAPEVLMSSLKDLMDMYANGKLKPHVSATFPLDRAPDGLELLRERRSTGKIVICP